MTGSAVVYSCEDRMVHVEGLISNKNEAPFLLCPECSGEMELEFVNMHD